MVMAMIGPRSSRAAWIAAWIGGSPECTWRSTFSTMTMASSTTRPTESTIASSVSRLIVNPAAFMRKTAPMSEIGIAITGMMRPRIEPRNRKITSTTMSSVSVSVFSTSWIDCWMYSVESYGMPTFMPTGSSVSSSCTASRTWRMTSSAFAVGSTHTPMNVAVSPLNPTSVS